ncbi:hypothetical protein DEJ16_04455 [Curtobacterium sp. MCJR17_055]|uniref:cell division protein PerM n=1 Tax=unclassified Curtobacterium TaxID=257496 RepID=UPI000D919489|nr:MULTISPECIES: DUF6350 family protein [unclassified Curtobacterium]PYY37603.1 hypothetical protein DEI87_00210 [Curtobacterium sp. MCBD17_029]PYY56215.1 hypothetical protein DEJ26_13780 [Curtobacterium sp. MCPF17_015]PYY56632.1 hypothetical protein DEJ16_04455 [Curtobacterium sp. MCJR17_055]WIB35824.1 DUF6350 family protein [Curtobacterium sp. MCJR17_043]
MNRLGTALLAVIEAIVTVGVGVGVALVPLTLLWAFEYGLQVDWSVFWTAAGNVWLVGHGVDVTFTLGSAAAEATGLPGASAPIVVTLAALGFAVVTAWLGGRAGRRFAETEHRVTGVLVGTAAVAALGLLVALTATTSATHPVIWQAVVLPALWFGVPAVVTAEVCRRRRGQAADPLTLRVVDLVGRIPALWRGVVGFGLRAGTVATACVVAVAGILVGFALLGSFAEVITLYERSHAGVVGGIAMTVGQLAFVPDLVGWATAWLVGPGFAIGAGSSVSPLGTVLGPLPAVPLLGALPTSGHTFGLVWILVPVVAGFVTGGLLRPRLVRALGSADSALYRALGGVVTGLVAGVLTGVVTGLTAGSAGPGRLAVVGPDALVVGAVAALEVGVPAIIALAIGSDLVRLPERSWIGERWHEVEDDVATADASADHGSLIAALDHAGAGRTTDVHRFSVDEVHDPVTHASTDSGAVPRATADLDRGGETLTSDRVAGDDQPGRGDDRPGRGADGAEHGGADTGLPAAPDAAPSQTEAAHAEATDVDLPDWARTDAVASERLDDHAGAAAGPRTRAGGAVDSVRARLRAAATGARDRAGDLRERAGDLRDRADALRHRPGGAVPPTTDAAPAPSGSAGPVPPRTDEQPAFPWSTEEFVAGRDDVDPEPPARPAPRAATWDTTDQIPEDELPWWRRPKGDTDA